MFDPSVESPQRPKEEALPAEDRPGVPLDLGRVARSVRAGARYVGVAALVALLCGALFARRYVAREYHAQASVLWEPTPSADGATSDEGRTLRTIADTVKLPNNLAEVRRRLLLDLTIDKLARRIEVTASTETRLLLLDASAESAEDARRLAQSLTDVFIEHQRRLEGGRIDDRLRMLASDEREARRALDETRARYDTFRRAHGVANLPAEQLAAIEHAARLRADADLARAEAEGEQAREVSLRGAAAAQTEITTLSESEQLLGAQRLADIESELAAARARMGDANPRLQVLQAQAEALRARATAAVRTGRIIGRNPLRDSYVAGAATATAVGSSLRRREELLRSSVQSTAARVTELAALDGESSTLLAAVAVAERHLAQVLTDLARIQDARRAPQTGLRVVAPPVAPELPTKSMRRVVIAVSPALGAILALLALVVRALRGGRAYSVGEVAFWVNAPVVASGRWPDDPAALDDLRDDLRMVLAPAAGTTLVVAAGERERLHVATLAAAFCGSSADGTPARPESVRNARGKNGRPKNGAAKAHTPAAVWKEGGRVCFEAPTQVAALRRAARAADRVLVVVESGAHAAWSLAAQRRRFGRDSGIACVVVGIGAAFAEDDDRAGSCERFQRSRGAGAVKHDGDEAAPPDVSA
jgi:uncharacterized protein involved in exopolysaccharide biosynthesis